MYLLPEDKVLHIIVGLWIYCLWRLLWVKDTYNLGFILFISIFKEIIDSFIPSRNTEFLDIIASIALPLIISLLTNKKWPII